MTGKKITQNGLLDILLNGLMKSNSLDESALGTLSQVSKLFEGRLKQDFIWQQLPTDDEPAEESSAQFIGPPISARDLRNINKFIEKLPIEIPCAQPRSSEDWAQINAVPRKIKSLLLALHAKIGPDLMKYVRDLYIPFNFEDSNAEEILHWLQALQALYNSAKASPDLFHGLFLSNHNFARRAYRLAQSSSLEFSTAVLEVCAECRFSSLTMNSPQLDNFFTSFAGLYAEKEAAHPQDQDMPFQVSHETIKAHINKTFTPKALLLSWTAIQSAPTSKEHKGSVSIAPSNEIKASPSP